jgi:xylulokinase
MPPVLVGKWDVNINLEPPDGVATITHGVHPSDGVFHLVDASGSAFIRVVPFFNAANVYAKALELTRMDYAEAEQLLQRNQPACAKGVFAVPYLKGSGFRSVTPTSAPPSSVWTERRPAPSSRWRSWKVWRSPCVWRWSIWRSIRRTCPSSGGGARSDAWCQVVANALGVSVHRFPGSQYEAARALVSLVQRSMNAPNRRNASGSKCSFLILGLRNNTVPAIRCSPNCAPC